jgi:hypothetical protein
MASKRRIRRRQCSGKKRYATHQEAEGIMFKVIHSGKKRGGWLHVYSCRFCGGYHFGHRQRGSNR